MLNELIDIAEQYLTEEDIKLIRLAYERAEIAHKDQVRNSGEKYIVHPLAVAIILASLNMDMATICAGLLHDVIEDTDYTFDDLKEEFGIEIASLVEGVTKLKNLNYYSRQDNQAENIRKMVLAMAKDIRVIIVKLADRLHNMRTLEYKKEDRQKEIAAETLEIYAPLAHRLGIFKIKWELEDLALRYKDPDNYYNLVDKVSKRRKEREEEIDNLISFLGNELSSLHINHDISGRPKNFYSIYKKMFLQGKAFDEIFDLTAIRVIVDSIKECYEVLGVVHSFWKPIPGRFKDYIAMPKPNMYQSIHTTVIGPKGEIFEVQIRTWEMHRTAEFGIAAHWKYKEGTSKSSELDNKFTWLRQLIEWQSDLNDPKDFMDALKMDFFSTEVFVFTPKGDVIDLPEGSTPIDFAYRVHSEIGHKCVGARVDGRIVPLDYKLKNGNIVEIMTSKTSTGPSRDWLNVVKSNQAKSRIRQWFKVKERNLNVIKGKDILEKETKRLGYNHNDFLKEEWLLSYANRISLNTIDDLYASLGYGSTTLNQIISRLKIEYNAEYGITEEKKQVRHEKKLNPNGKGIVIAGIDNVKIRFARCCNPVPGDDIVGYVTKGNGVAVHRADCANIMNSDENRLLRVDWDSKEDIEYSAEIQIDSFDRSGLLTEITAAISDSDLEIASLNARRSKSRLVHINLVLQIKNTEELYKLMKKLRSLESVVEVYRVSN